jgi:23S rRNA (pseudouridine1915-N3)-methyltransferase
MAKKIKFIFVGKLKKNFWKEAQKFYEKRLSSNYAIEQIIIKDANGSLSIEDRKRIESQRILKKIGDKDFVICLDEKGSLLSSHIFAKKLTKWMENPHKIPCFVVGGPFGIDEELKNRVDFLLSLSPLTFPHEMARIILLEQIYRAHQILCNFPYHY